MISFVVDFTSDVNPDGTVTLHDNRGKKALAKGDVVKLSDTAGNSVVGAVTRTLENIVWVLPDHTTWQDAIFA
jgi:hypothetical protein